MTKKEFYISAGKILLFAGFIVLLIIGTHYVSGWMADIISYGEIR